MDLAEVVIGKVQRDRVFVHFDFLAEAICQAGEPAHVHTHREVLTLNVRRRDVLANRIPGDDCSRGADHCGRRVSPSGTGSRERLRDDAVVNIDAERLIDRSQVGHVAVRRKLRRVDQPAGDILHQRRRGLLASVADDPRDHQLGHRVDSRPRPNVAPTFGLFLRAGVLFLRTDKRPDFIALDADRLQFANVDIVELLAGGAQIAQQFFDRHPRDTGDPSRGPEAVAFNENRYDPRPFFCAQPVHVTIIRSRASKSSNLNSAGNGTMERPSDFDWVTARSQCSAFNVFNSLKEDARKNTETVNALAEGRGAHAFQFGSDAKSFWVVQIGRLGEIGVRVSLRDEQIHVESQGVDVAFSAGLTLNDDGECRLLVEGVALDRWQVLRRALEPLFFRVVGRW